MSGELALSPDERYDLSDQGARSWTLGPLRGRRIALTFQEPTAALDPLRRIGGQIAEVICWKRRTARRTAPNQAREFPIAHNLLVPRNMTDRIAVMQRGRLLEQAPTEELFLRPRHPYTERVLPSVPRIGDAPAESGSAPFGGDSQRVDGGGCRYRAACRYAQAECEWEDPRPRERTPGHVVACRRADELTFSSPLR